MGPSNRKRGFFVTEGTLQTSYTLSLSSFRDFLSYFICSFSLSLSLFILVCASFRSSFFFTLLYSLSLYFFTQVFRLGICFQHLSFSFWFRKTLLSFLIKLQLFCLNLSLCLSISMSLFNTQYFSFQSVWTDWTIYWTLGNFSKSFSTINLSTSPTLLGNFCKGVKIFDFSSEIILGNIFRHVATFYWSHWLQHANSLSHKTSFSLTRLLTRSTPSLSLSLSLSLSKPHSFSLKPNRKSSPVILSFFFLFYNFVLFLS